MAHYPVPGRGRRLALSILQAGLFSLALFVVLVFRADHCAVGAAGTSFALWPPHRFQPSDLAALAVLWPLFLLFTLPAALAGPGPRARRLKRGHFALLLAGLAVALFAGPTPACDSGLTPLGTALVVAALGLGLRAALVHRRGHVRET